MAFPPSPPVPQRGVRSTFSNVLDTFIRWMGTLPALLDAYLAQLTTLAAGGANTFAYKFDAVTDDTDPGPGFLRLGALVQNASTVLRLDPVTAGGADISGLLTSVLAGTSAVKGSMRLQKLGDPSKWMIFDIASGTGTGYLNFAVIPRASSSASPFTAGDDLMVYINYKGDKGDVGNADKKVQTAPAPVAGVITVDYRNGNCLAWSPTAASTVTLNITNWPAAGTLGEFWIVGVNLGAATVSMSSAINWLRPDGTFTSSVSINTNHGATLRSTGEDNVLLWGRAGAPDRGKVAR